MPAAALAESVDRNRSLDEFAVASEEADESDTAETADTADTGAPDEPDETTDTADADASGGPDDTVDTAESDDTVDTAESDDTVDTAEPGERDTTDAGEESLLPDPSTVEPLSPTYAAGREAACVECDASVAVRWRGSDGYVCADCKEW